MPTEEEAKTKWCPHARVYDEDGPASNRLPETTNPAAEAEGEWRWNFRMARNCITSGCMAWRWASDSGGPQKPGEPPADALGYCGLAGKPEAAGGGPRPEPSWEDVVMTAALRTAYIALSAARYINGAIETGPEDEDLPAPAEADS